MVQFKTNSFKRHLSSFTFSLRFFWDSQRWSVHNSTDTRTTLTTMVDVSLYYDSHKILLPMDRIPTGEIVLPHRPERRQNDKRRRGTFPQKQSRHARRGSLIISILKTPLSSVRVILCLKSIIGSAFLLPYFITRTNQWFIIIL